MVLVLQDEVLEVVFQRQILGGLAGLMAIAGLLCRQAGKIVLQIIQFDVDAQQLGADALALAEDHRALDGVLQFAYVAWPGIMTNGLFGVGGEAQVVAALALALAGEEGSGDFEHVAATFAQWR